MGKGKENKHYSDSGGHKERSNFWKAIRAVCSGDDVAHKAAIAEYVARRFPRRVTRDGR